MKESEESEEDSEKESEKESEYFEEKEWVHVKTTAQHKRQLRREETHIFHRLSSILSDSLFTHSVRSSLCLSLPFLANLRCGLWYLSHFDDTCYFKSTDGHVGHWTFSLARLNLNVIERACEGEREGCVIVDSTRKGKEFPDR